MKTDSGRKRKNAHRENARARRASSGVMGRLLVMLAVVAAMIFGVAIFFKVNTIEVQGNCLYSAQKISEASGLQQGDNLLTVNKAAAGGNIRASLPYVEDVSIRRVLPDTVVIKVKESTASFAIQSDTNAVWLINIQGKALEKVDENALSEYPQILGVRIQNPTAGLPVSSNTQSALDAALAVLQEFDGTGILEHVASVNVEKEYDIIIWYDDRYEVKLGGTEQLDYKADYLLAILDSLSEYQAGTIDLTLSTDNKATFEAKT